jgi:(1->4)-alpha-D-glucan 1-alpha-D-glucosylmutase
VSGGPRSTYRLQFGPHFRFADAQRIVPYLAALGVGTIYASPYFRARPGSEHGYDIVDHNQLNPEIGDESEHQAFVRAAQAAGLSHIVDFVPNHMGIGNDNPWWNDVLALGRNSSYAHFFDIDWHARSIGRGKVVLPFLGDHYGAIVARDELAVTFDRQRASFSFHYYDHVFPLAPHTYATVLSYAAVRAAPERETELLELAGAFDALRARSRARQRNGALTDRITALRAEVAERCARDPGLATAIEEGSARLSSDPDRLDALAAAQHYRLAFWRVASDEINYRRFFDINDLAGLRVEDAEVLGQTHQLLFALIADGCVQGVRIDHVDGLANPGGYANLLVDRAAALGQPLYVVVEKILADGEVLRPSWRIAGTTGYDFMNLVLGLFVEAEAVRFFDRLYARVLGRATTFADEAYEAKRRIMRVDLASELQVLADGLVRIAQRDRRSVDFTLTLLRRALADVIAAFDVYRTYVVHEDIDPEDRAIIERAVGRARERSEFPDAAVFDFLCDVLTLDVLRAPGAGYERNELVRWVLRFQQYTGPVAAKAIEDTAFYRYVRLAALNEVGGNPAHFGRTVAEFHAENAVRARTHPQAMIATATHDHKRGEDARLRIAAVTEFPAEWSRAIARWSRANATLAAPERADEYLFYQTVVATLPPGWLGAGREPDAAEHDGYVERIVAYALKAAREAKLHTSWADPQQGYEKMLEAFVRGALSPAGAFWHDVCAFAASIAPVAALHGLAQVALKLTAPGVPDVYQGCELWDFSLVDPDNRRPVDYGLRAEWLASFARAPGRAVLVDELLGSWVDGRIKLYLTWRLLQLRRERPGDLAQGYRALASSDDGIVAFARGPVVVVAPRLARRRLNGRGLRVSFGDETIGGVMPESRWRNVVDDGVVIASAVGELRAGDVFARAPVAVLVPLT